MCLSTKLRSIALCAAAGSCFVLFATRSAASAQEATPTPTPGETQQPTLLLSDTNGDGGVSVLFFGDSITYGTGGTYGPGEDVEHIEREEGRGGYPLRVQQLSAIPSVNSGEPGEEITTGGRARFVRAVSSANTDAVVILEGANDALHSVPPYRYRRALQRMVNVATFLGKTVIVATTPPPTGNHGAIAPTTASYAAETRDLARVNSTLLVDYDQLFRRQCPNLSGCSFYNLPEGLHPNRRGYEAMAQEAIAEFFGLDTSAPGGTAALEQLLQIAPGSSPLN